MKRYFIVIALAILLILRPLVSNAGDTSIEYHLPNIGMNISFPEEVRVTTYNNRNTDNEEFRVKIDSSYEFNKLFESGLELFAYGFSLNLNTKSVYITDITIYVQYSGFENTNADNYYRFVDADKQDDVVQPFGDVLTGGRNFYSVIYYDEGKENLIVKTCQNKYDIRISVHVAGGINDVDIVYFFENILSTITFDNLEGTVSTIPTYTPLPAMYTNESDFEYEIDTQGNATITKYNGNAQDVVVPATINGHKVTHLGFRAFSKCSMRSVVISEGIEVFEGCVFEDCDLLEKVTLPSTLVDLGWSTFDTCINLVSINIPRSIEIIDNWTFCGCDALTNILLPESVKTIKIQAFFSSGLQSIFIPSTVNEIEGNAFGACDNLVDILVDSANKNYSSRDGILYNKEQTQLVTYPAGKTNTVFIVPDNVTSIGNDAFNCGFILKEVIISKTVKKIGDGAFNYTNIKHITLPSGIEIGDGAFDSKTVLIYSSADTPIITPTPTPTPSTFPPENGYAEGRYWSNGLYKGNFNNYKPNGYGECFFDDGTVYKGNFKDAAFNDSNASMTWKDGSNYVGAFVNDERTGYAVYTCDDGTVYKGNFKKGMFNDTNATIAWKDGEKYTGAFVDGKRTGRGVLVSSLGKYEGDFVDGAFDGEGVLITKDGLKYEGEWRNDCFNGYGRLRDIDGIVYSGTWVDNKPECEGLILITNSLVNVRSSPDTSSDTNIMSKAHKGELYQCKDSVKDFYRIILWNGSSAYVHNSVCDYLSGYNKPSFSSLRIEFIVDVPQRADIYSWPGIKREKDRTTWFINANSKLDCLGKTVISGSTWYLSVITLNGESYPELIWIKATGTTVISGDVNANIFPSYLFE